MTFRRLASLLAASAGSRSPSVSSRAVHPPAESDTTGAEHTSAILVQPIHDAQVVRGDDGKDHVEYDLLVDNAVGDPVTLTSVTVLDPAGKQLGRVDGTTLAAATQNLYTHAPVPAIPSSGAVAVEVDLALAPGTVPARVTNRIAYSLAPGDSAVTIGAGEVDATPDDSQQSTPISGTDVDGPLVAI